MEGLNKRNQEPARKEEKVDGKTPSTRIPMYEGQIGTDNGVDIPPML